MASTESYDWSEFDLSMYYLRPRSEVFRAWATTRGLESFFIGRAEHFAASGQARGPDEVVETGDEYRWTYLHDFQHSGRFLSVEIDHHRSHAAFSVRGASS